MFSWVESLCRTDIPEWGVGTDTLDRPPPLGQSSVSPRNCSMTVSQSKFPATETIVLDAVYLLCQYSTMVFRVSADTVSSDPSTSLATGLPRKNWRRNESITFCAGR